MSKFKNLKSNKAITLIALIITVIVMLILVGVSVSILVDSDLIGTAEQTVAKWNEVADKEKEDLDSLSNRIEDILKDQCKHEYGAWEITKAATCTEEGTQQRTCSICANIETQNFTATGHNYSETGRVVSTCSVAGKVTYTCSACGDSYDEDLDLLAHTEVTDAAVSATCTTAGLTEGSHCSACSSVITGQETVPATGHQNTTIINASASYTGDTYCNDCKTTIATGSEIILTFTINGTTYNAKGGMTWEQWFTSAYNTTGETEGTIKDSEGNEVAITTPIVDGAEYDAEFDDGMRTVTITGDLYATAGYVSIGDVYYNSSQTLTVPVGTVIRLYVSMDDYQGSDARIEIGEDVVYDKGAYSNVSGTNPYEYTVTTDVRIELETKSGNAGCIYVTEY